MRIFCRVIVGVPSIGLTLIAFLDFQFAVPSGAHTCLFISRLACFLSREIISGGRHVCTGRGSRIQAKIARTILCFLWRACLFFSIIMCQLSVPRAWGNQTSLNEKICQISLLTSCVMDPIAINCLNQKRCSENALKNFSRRSKSAPENALKTLRKTL